MAKRGQISVEYLIIVGFVIFLVISILGVSIYYAYSVRDSIKENQLSGFADKVISNAEAVSFAGEPSQVTITAFLPEGVQELCILEDGDRFFLKIDIQTSSGLSVIAFPSDVDLSPVNCAGGGFSTSSGTKKFTITAQVGGEVQIVES
jgi:hypothetical protein